MIKSFHLTPIIEKTVYLISFFFMGCFLGFVWELLMYWFSHDIGFLSVLSELRGFLHGPWVPIYGIGCTLLFLISRIFSKKPVHFFTCSICICGIIEYGTSWLLELIFHARWWDYSDKFLNFNGRIYLAGLLFFGFAGMLVVYLLEPLFQKFFLSIPFPVRSTICTALLLLFLIDVAISLHSPNLGIGVSVLI